VLEHYMPGINASDVLERLKLKSQRYFLLSAHREENVDSPENLQDLLTTMQALAKQYEIPIIVSTHPRTRQRLEKLETDELDARIQFLKPFGFFDYIRLQMEAFCVLSDSGTITEEASLLNLPAITIRNAHERPEGMDEGTLIMSGLKASRVLDAVRVVREQQESTKPRAIVSDYQGGIVSQKVLRIVLSYTEYVNRVVWSA
jgi:UDP-N-acetylglucosamine 2-epimerase